MGKEFINRIFIALLIFIVSLSHDALAGSVLANGEWYRFSVDKDGVYILDYEFLAGAGLDVDNIHPDQIQLFGNGGKLLPQPNYEPRPEDLIENAIYVHGADDGQFDPGDYVLFYGQGPHELIFVEADNKYTVGYQHHYSSDSSFYFLTVGDVPGLRLETSEDLGHNFPTISSFDDLQFHELDLRKLNGIPSGREWYGEVFRNGISEEVQFESTGLLANSNIQLITSLMASSLSGSSFAIFMNNVKLGDYDIETIPNATYGKKGNERLEIINVHSSRLPDDPGNIVIRNTFESSETGAIGYLNYINIWMERSLRTYSDQVRFRSLKSKLNTQSTFMMEDTGNPALIWDVTDSFHPKIQEMDLMDNHYMFGAKTDELKEFIVFNLQNVMVPIFSKKVVNQDLHGMVSPEFLIISHEDFLEAASRLSEHRMSQGMTTSVVTIEEVYNEFSSGSQDVTAIRDFIRYLSNKGENEPVLKYVLLFGKGSYDYKNIGPSPYYNFVPIYESRNSLHPIYSYSSDDYFGFLDEEEGEWEETFTGDHTMDVAIGRFPVTTMEEANSVVQKIIRYETHPDTFGPWRNNICFVGDDGDGTDGIVHSKDADLLSVMVDTAYSNFNIEKIYIDAYPQVILPNNAQTAPEVNEAINNAIKNGVLIINYTGHGNEQQWAHESILKKSMINGWTNRNKLPLFVTSTCEFGRHDDKLQSAAETALIKRDAGAIAMVTTARPVFSSTNFILNRSFYSHVFEKENGKYLTLGQIFMRTKNGSLSGPVNRNFSLLGDPSMKLAYPEQQIMLDEINEMPIDQPDTLKALKKILVKGSVIDENDKRLTDFNGIVYTKVFDKRNVFQTLGTQDPVMEYEERKSLIFNGEATVKDGNFLFEFVVPKNISYDLGDGKISLYASNRNQTMDASGANDRLQVGGSQEITDLDTTPPRIILYLDDSTFRSGDLTSDRPVLLARLFDENGISIIESGISQGIVAELDNESTYVLNDFYTAELDSYQRGRISYQLTNLEEGSHQLKMKVWDTHNNLAEETIDFIIGEPNRLVINNLLNYPNPFHDETIFSMEHNRSGEDIEVIIEIFSTEGELVKTISGVTFNSAFRINDIRWDGRSGSGEKLKTGLYIYRVFLRSLKDGAKNTDFKKLVIIN